MQSYTEISDDLLNFDLKSFINKYLGDDITKLTLQFSGKYPFGFAILAEQLKLYQKAQIKLPSFTKSYCFFTSKSFEQASSEPLANFKASLVSGKSCLDLSGGLGVDDWAFANKFDQVISLDTEADLNKIVRKNFELLRVKNIIRIDADANEYIRTNGYFDLIYLDADRRPGIKNKRIAGISDSEPDILKIKKRLFELTDVVLVKLSPMLDISMVIKELIHVHEIYVVSLNNEVKELLVILKKDHLEPVIHAVNIDHQHQQVFSAVINKPVEPAGNWVKFNDRGKYFYEPALCLIKSGISMNYAKEKDLKMLAVNSSFFLSDHWIEDFFGRSFEVIARIDFSKSKVKKFLTERNIVKANISKRNFAIDVDELKKIFSIQDGGDEYLFFSQNNAQEKLMFHCRKIK